MVTTAVWAIAVAAGVLGVLLGTAGALWIVWREVGIARQQAADERTRADNAIDALAKQLRGEPISIAGAKRYAEQFEESLRTREELGEMFVEDTEDLKGSGAKAHP
jgi:hypothetical protein